VILISRYIEISNLNSLDLNTGYRSIADDITRHLSGLQNPNIPKVVLTVGSERDYLANIMLHYLNQQGLVASDCLSTHYQENAHDSKSIGIGHVDITFYRDDFEGGGDPRGSVMPRQVDGSQIYIVTKKIHTGRSVRAAMRYLFQEGRPAGIYLASLLDFAERELPIQPDFTYKLVEILPQVRDQIRKGFIKIEVGSGKAELIVKEQSS